MNTSSLRAESFLGDCLANRYQLKEVLGKGGMGFVFLAEDLELPRTVAVKMIRPEFVQDKIIKKRVERECAMHARVGMHPNIITLHDKIIENDKIFLIMEYVEGKTLANILKDQRHGRHKIAFKQIIQIVIQLLAALDVIHSNNIIHRDIKPSNVIFVPSGKQSDRIVVKLMDFGIARSEFDDNNVTMLTAFDSAGPGTPAYMSPERIDCKSFGDFSSATDLYSLGIIFYELIYAQPPFLGTLTDVFSAHIAKKPDIDVLDISHSLKKVISQSLEKEQKDRFKTAVDFKNALESALLESSDEAKECKNEMIDEEGVTLLSIPEMHLQIAPSNSAKSEFSIRERFWKNRVVSISCFVMIIIFLFGFAYYKFWLEDKKIESVNDSVVIPQTVDVVSEPVSEERLLVTPLQKSSTNDSPKKPELPPDVESSSFSYYPSAIFFENANQLGQNPSPFSYQENRGDQVSAEASVNKVYGARSSQASRKRINEKAKGQHDSPRFEIKRKGTRSVSPE